MKNNKWPSDFGLRKEKTRRKSLILKVGILITAILLLLFTILYTTLHALKNNKRPENVRRPPNASSPSAEKIVASQVTVEKQIVEQISPRPFLNDLRGAAPSTFLAPHGTTSDYPQIQNHRQPTHPKNIQDIIEYLSENAHRQKELIKEEQAFANTNRERDRFKVFGRILGTRASHHHQQQQQQSFTRDPFFAYKPQDPSDINLLAPSSFRFAPAILPSSFYKQRQKLIQEAEALNDRPVENSKNPLKLTLSIYPYGNSNKVKLFQGPGLTPRYRYPSSGTQPGRMIVHLNVYPGPGGKFAVDQENEDRIATGQTESAPHLQ